MAFENDQNEFPIQPDGENGKRTSVQHLPRYFRTPANKKFLSSTLDQLIQPGEVEKISSYFGRNDAKARTADDSYISDVSSDRQNYQLEPALVIKDDFDNVSFYKDYNDYINQLRAFGNTNTNHSLINAQEYYSWNPHIDWDKFVNFREYYWLPSGPQVLPIYGQTKEVSSTFKVSIEENDDNVAYKFTPTGLTQNPTLKLYKGQTYIFEVDTPGYPIAFSTNRSFTPGQAIVTETVEGVIAPGQFEAELYDFDGYDTGEYIVQPVEGGIEGFTEGDNISTLYTDGVEASTVWVEKGTIKFTVPLDAPNRLFYISKDDVNTSGLINIYNILENTEINVEEEILQKKTYQTRNDVELSNGMLVEFLGDVTPAKYAQGTWYVEGVGDSIELIAKSDLEITGTYSESKFVPFDSENFDRVPFGQALNFPRDKDYITINRSAIDGNPWTRHNRWFHKDVIEKVAKANDSPVNLDQTARASRPIIEFEGGLRLYNFGSKFKSNVDLIDDKTTDVFSNIEGSVGYNVDGINLTDGLRVLFTADPDKRVNGRIYKVKFIDHNGSRQLALQDEDDTNPTLNETVLVKAGEENTGKIYWYNGTTWIKAQEKVSANQPPYFNLYDADDESFDSYQSTSFTGTKLFSYKEGTGSIDSVLGFPLTYRNIQNSGDIVFDFNLLNDVITYQEGQVSYTKKSDTATLRKYTDLNTYENESGWKKAFQESTQKVVRQYIVSGQKNNFAVDVYDRSGDLNELNVTLTVNNERRSDWEINRENGIAYIRFDNDLNNDDIVVMLCTSEANKNENGKYEFPINLQNNPLNENIVDFTYGEVNDHVNSIIDNLNTFTGKFPGSSNLRDLGSLTEYGTKFVQHSGAIPLAMYHITNKDFNLIKSMRYARKEYAKFKRSFVSISSELGIDGSPRYVVDKIIEEWQRDKSKQSAFYWTDMIGSGANKTREFTIVDTGNKFYSLTSPFNLSDISAKAVYIYLNDSQLLHNKDYAFTAEGFIRLDDELELAVNDTITIYEYESTDASFIPPTPSKLGMWPLYRPTKYVDSSYRNPMEVIQGHDGSIIRAYGDYRDDLILELENRIYNNVKIQYDSNILDVDSFVGHASRDTGFTSDVIDDVVITDFIEWLAVAGDPDYTDNSFYDRTDSFTWNYSKMTDPYNNPLQGFWRAIYNNYLSTDTPHTTPWKILGFVEKPDWWQEVYGPAPYTKENLILWDDLENGRVREPNKPIRYRSNYIRKELTKYIPVDAQGNLVSPYESGYARGLIAPSTNEQFVFGDQAPVESAWRKSSEYPFALLTAWLINQPTKVMSTGFDRARLVRNTAGQIVYSATDKRLTPNDVVFPNTSENTERVTTAGLINYMFNYINADVTKLNEEYSNQVLNINVQLGFKMGGFSTPDKFKLLLDSRTPSNEGNVFIPEENYKIFFNVSTPVDTVSYSGVIIEKSESGWIVKGYDKSRPYFVYNKPLERASDPVVNIGGVSENFLEFVNGSQYRVGQIIRNGDLFYRVKVTHTAVGFQTENFTKLAQLPIDGGVEGTIRRSFEQGTSKLRYGTLLRSNQDVIDFLLGYGIYLESQGFDFNNFNKEIESIENWELSAREFLFWTTQNWSPGTLLTLSPSASALMFARDNAVVDNIFDNFYDYTLLKADGAKLKEEFANTIRSNQNEFGLRLKNTQDGIYFLKIPLVQKEHVVLIDNKTVFNDVIYNPAPGYRQARIKGIGYRTTNWNGGFDIPGFTYDNVKVTNWEPNTDYAISDVVQYKTFFYSAKSKVVGTTEFNDSDWYRLPERPKAELTPNFDYKANQFSDFYDLDSDNFDTEQQRLAQHLIGYQKRDYLENVITDSVSQYKFYQGFIQDKGTRNSLTKLFDALSNTENSSLEFFEEWAFKVGQYGASGGFDEVEYLLDESKIRLQPQPFQLVRNINPLSTDLVYRYALNDVYSKPSDYDHAPFPTKDLTETYIRTAGYVAEEDIDYKFTNYDDLLEFDVNSVSVGQYIWVAKRDQSWDVLRQTETILKVKSILNSSTGEVEITFNKVPDFNKDDIIGVLGTTPETNKFYKVNRISLNIAYVTASGEVPDVPDTNGFLVKLESVRVATLSDVNPKITRDNYTVGEKIWVDSDETNNWTVLENSNTYTLGKKSYNATLEGAGTIVSGERVYDIRNFGSSLSANDLNTVLVVGAPSPTSEKRGRIDIHFRAAENLNLIQGQVIDCPDGLFDGDNSFGESTALSSDGRFLFVGAPYASNVKTNYRGIFDPANTYQENEIVQYTNQFWKAKTVVFPSDDSLAYPSFSSHIQELIKTYENTVYDNLWLVLRGNFTFQEESTDHVLVKAQSVQYAGTEPGDKLQLLWNSKNTRYPSGVNPFNDTPELSSDFFNGEHVIQEKIDDILLVDNTQAIPDVGEVINSDIALGVVAYTYTTGDNRTLIYVKNANGNFADEGTLELGDITIGLYERAVQQPSDDFEGWWKIGVGSTFNSTATIETKPYLVVQDIIKQSVSRTVNYFENILNIVDDTSPGVPSYIETLTANGDSGFEISDKWVFRLPITLESDVSIGDTFNFWFNEYRTPEGILQSPTVIAPELTHEYLNTTLHTVQDKWNGWINVNLTNFDNSGSPTIGDADYNPNYGNPYIPVVGDIIQDNDTGATAEVTYVEKLFNDLRLWIKNVNTTEGPWKLGSEFRNISSISIVEGSQGEGVIRLVGTTKSVFLDGETIGSIIVVDRGENLTPGSTRTLQNFEYWIYKTQVLQGIARDANPPSSVNNDWQRIYNIPVENSGTQSGYNRQGAYAVYERNTSNFYELVNFYTMPDSNNFRHLGASIDLIKRPDGGYSAYISSKGNGTFEQPGRINIINYSDDNGWVLGADTDYRGEFVETVAYYEGEFVKYAGQIYSAATNILPGSFNSNDWTAVNTGVDLNGFIPNNTGFIVGTDSSLEVSNLIEFGTQYDVSKNGHVLASIVKYGDQLDSALRIPKLAIYRLVNGQFMWDQIIEGELAGINYGSSVAVSDDGKFIAVGANNYSEDYTNSGAVYIYEAVHGSFVLVQTVTGPQGLSNEKFGSNIKFNNDRLVVTSTGGDLSSTTEFDNNETVFDNGTTLFATTLTDTGEIFVFERAGNRFIYADKITNADENVKYFGDVVELVGNHVYAGLPTYLNPPENNSPGSVFDFRTPTDTNLWTRKRQARPVVDIDKIKGVSIYNKDTNVVDEYIDYIDPLQGKIAGPATSEITFKTTYDPASYNVADDNIDVVKDVTIFNTTDLVGKLWWDVDAVRFINPYSNTGNIFNVTNQFNTIFPGTEVEVYEWVETTLLPSEWDDQADTEEGLTVGISGLSKYGDTVYSTRRVYDEEAQKFTNFNYFWVRNKATVPDLPGRTISGADVQELIRDPAGQGYKFVNFLNDNEWSLHNIQTSVTGKDSVIKFAYWNINDTEKNIHNQYKVITDGLSTSRPKSDLEEKWYDSLIGFDRQGREVPDRALSTKDTYGILNSPRQTIFVNRTEALKQAIERVNTVLKKYVLIDDFDLSDLESNDPSPTLASRKYDQIIDSELELRFVSTSRIRQATLNATIIDGKVIRVDILDGGRGYKTVPTVTIDSENGSNAVIKLEINNLGSVVSATVFNEGENYQSTDRIVVRKYAVLVNTDTSYANRWSIYEYVGGEYPWNRIISQSYDVRDYWSYCNWYAEGYNELTKADFVIEETYKLSSLDDKFGNIVKINNVGSGGWLLLRKIGEDPNVDYTVNYETIGRENSTVELSKALYDYSDQLVGFDSFGYDDSAFDLIPVQELRIILQSLRDNIFVDNLAIHYNELFFAQMRYVLVEQPFVDWMFKTSFVKAKHNVGKLRKDITFNNDYLESYEDYVREVKPYKTKIREYLSTYEGSEDTQTSVTDFDLPPFYSTAKGKIIPVDTKVIDNTIDVNGITSYPQKHWLDNASFEVTGVTLSNQGLGYANPPTVEFTGGGGSGAKAEAYVGTNGKITNIEVTNPGSGYLSAPTVVINGAVTDGGTLAKANAVIGNSNLRSMHFNVKFDRVTGAFFITTLDEEETFTGSGGRYEFKLKWPANLRTDKVSITVDGNEILPGNYTIANVDDSNGKTHSRKIAKVIFNNPPANNSNVVISYYKDISLLTAADRINLFYNPETGQLANDLGQLLDGVDYGGVQVKSFTFGGGSGWDADPWFTSAYDSYDNTYEDEVFRLGDDSTKVYDFAKPLEQGVEYNVYKNGVRIDDPNFGTPSQTNSNALIASITGAGQTGFILYDDGASVESTVIVFDEEIVPSTTGDVFVIRKNTSDGSFIPDPRAYDTLISGGDIAYASASGVNPEDIIIDGDGFVTPTTSKGPEELVPGQVLDTLDIRVFDRVGEGASIIESVSHIGNGTTTKYAFNGLPQGKHAIFVKVNNNIIETYTVNYKTKEITFTAAPADGAQINIVTMSGNGEQILDIDTFTGDGSTIQFVTRVDWKEELNSLITVNGEKVDYILETTDSSYDTANKVAITFGTPPAGDAVINYGIYASEAQTFSEIKTDTFRADGNTATYELSTTPFSSLPASHNLIVRVGDTILNAGYNESFTIDDRVEYQLRNWQQPGGTLGANDILVLLDGVPLTYTTDFIFRPANSSVELFENVKIPGATLDVFVTTDGEYTVDGDQVTLNDVPEGDTLVNVTHFSKHDIQQIDRKNYDIIRRTTLSFESAGDIEYNHLLAGLIKLERETIDAEYVWVVLNGKIQTPSVDYKVTNDRLFIRMATPLDENDVIEIMQFAEDGPSVAKFGFRQFKDMLNRTVYKRLGDVNKYRLQQDLKTLDKEIIVENGETMFVPDKANNIPGVVFINGERIEYMVKDGNSLQQLRRGTLGTGVKDIHNIGDELFDQGFQQTVPYQDKTLVNTYEADGVTAQFELDWTPASVDEFEVFVAGKRQRKNAMYMFDQTVDQDSPEGDVLMQADFSINNNTLTLLNVPADGVRVTIIRRVGKVWNDPGKTLGKTKNSIAQFLRAEQVDLPK